MKRLPAQRADYRTPAEKLFGLLMAVSNDDLAACQAMLNQHAAPDPNCRAAHMQLLPPPDPPK